MFKNTNFIYDTVHFTVSKILHRQFEWIYADNNVSDTEAIHKVALQELFDLSYDQFEAFKRKTITQALESGADVSKLDIATLPRFKSNKNRSDF